VIVPMAVTKLFAKTLCPARRLPTESAPEATAVTVSTVNVMEPVTTLGAMVPVTTAMPAPTVYVPVPPAPVPSAVMAVPAATPAPEMTMPTNSEPEFTVSTVSVEPAMEPVKLTGHANAPTVAKSAAVPAVQALHPPTSREAVPGVSRSGVPVASAPTASCAVPAVTSPVEVLALVTAKKLGAA